MSEQIREQVSAFLDGELPASEAELLLKRLTRDGELRESFGRYALIGEALRGSTSHALLTKGFASRVNLAIDGEPVSASVPVQYARPARWWRPVGSVAVAAGVAALAVFALQQRSVEPGVVTAGVSTPVARAGVVSSGPQLAVQTAALPTANFTNREAISYTTPRNASDAPAALAPARLTNYVFAHSKYSLGLGQRGVLADMLIEDEDQAQFPQTPQSRHTEAAPSAP